MISVEVVHNKCPWLSTDPVGVGEEADAPCEELPLTTPPNFDVAPGRGQIKVWWSGGSGGMTGGSKGSDGAISRSKGSGGTISRSEGGDGVTSRSSECSSWSCSHSTPLYLSMGVQWAW